MECIMEQLRDLDKAAQAENKPSLEVIRRVLEEPVKWLTNDVTIDRTQRQALVRHAAWKHHVWVVSQTVIPNWAFALSRKSSSQRTALETTLLGLTGNEPALEPELTRVMVQVSLPLLLEALHVAQDAPLEALDIYEDLLRKSVSPKLIRLYLQGPWLEDVRFFCSVICSIPARLANAFGIMLSSSEHKEEWYLPRKFYAALARQLSEQVYECCASCGSQSTDKDWVSSHAAFAAELLGKMMRQGHTDDCLSVIYPTVISQLRNADKPLLYRLASLWSFIWRHLETLSMSEKATLSVLNIARQTLLSAAGVNETSPEISADRISSASYYMAVMIFGFVPPTNIKDGDDDGRQQRIERFLFDTLFGLAKTRTGDLITMRLGVAASIHAASLCDGSDNSSQESVRTGNLPKRTSDMFMKVLRRLIDTWVDPTFIRHCSYREHEYITGGIILATGYLSKEQTNDLFTKVPLASGVNRWFSSDDMSKVKLGVVVAESMSAILDPEGSQLDTGVLDDKADQRYKELKKLIHAKDAFAEVTNEEIFKESKDEVAEYDATSSGNETEDEELDPDMVITGEDQDDHNGFSEPDLEPYPMEEESDEETAGYRQSGKTKRKRIKEPMYILDLINYLRDHEDPIKLEIGLGAAERLIRQKTGFGTEIEESAIVLAKYLIGLPEVYDLTDLKQRQQGALVALVVAVPKTVTGFLIDQLYDRNSSTAQRQMILSVIILAVRELSGLSNDDNQDMADNKMDKALLALEDLKLEDHDALKQVGKVRVFSHSAEIRRKQQERIKRNRFSGLAGPVFFFPLLVGWWEGAQGRMKMWIGRDTMLAERFVITLNVIVLGATNTPEKQRIVTEYFEFALSLRFAKVSQRVTRALLLGLDIILNVCYEHQEVRLVQEHYQELTEVKAWMEEILEAMREDELKQLAINILARLVEVSKTV